MFYLGQIFYILLLLINSLAVLSEDRFLAKIGWAARGSTGVPAYGAQDPYGESAHVKLINLIAAIRTLLRIPLIAVNSVVIIYELILG